MRTIQSQMLTLLYQTLLMEFGINAVKRVFNDELFEVDDTEMSPSEFFPRLIINPPPKIPFQYLITLFTRTENYCVEQNIPLETFRDKMILVKAEAFCMTNAPDALHFIEPFFHQVFQEPNLYHFAFKVISKIHTTQIPESSYKLINHEVDETKGMGTMQLLYDRENLQKYAYDITIWKSFIIKNATAFINIPPFNSVTVKSETRTIETILEHCEYTIQDGILTIGEQKMGTQMLFSEFIESNSHYKDAFSPDGWSGFLVEEDFYSEKQQRLLLRKGCFYNAPVVLMDISYTLQEQTTERILKNITKSMQPIDTSENEQYLHFFEKHNEFIESVNGNLEIVYHSEQNKILINGNYFSKNFPATLLYYLCREYTERNRTNFLYKDIVMDPLFYIDTKKPNLTVRIKRLKEKLSEEFPQLNITHSGRGEFTFGADCPLIVSSI
jgi:hypothetical protein